MSLRSLLIESIGNDLSDEAAESTCEACGAASLFGFYEARGVPSQTCVLLNDYQSAWSYPTGEVLLAFCVACGFIQNTRFDPDLVDYSQVTEESQAFSPKFTDFATWLADELVDRFRLRDKSVLEVGSGKGDFLLMLGERGITRGLGIDPGFLSTRLNGPEINVEFVRDYYGEQSTDLTADFVFTRHLLEHVPDVSRFLGWLRESTSSTPGASLFIEVPDVRRILAEGAFWDVYYEHCSYFTLGSLARTLRNTGFGVTWLQLGFDDQYLLAGASPGVNVRNHKMEDTVAEIGALVASFALRAKSEVQRWRQTINDVVEGGGKVAVWGGGSKASAFLSSVGLTQVTVVDINPFKQGKWLPGVAAEVRAPQALVDVRPQLVIPMNPIYAEEIRCDLADMGLSPLVAGV